MRVDARPAAFYCLGAGRGEITFVARYTTNNDFIMSELKKASDRLERAVERLDKALANGRPSARDAHTPALASTIAAVERERDSLHADIDALRLSGRSLRGRSPTPGNTRPPPARPTKRSQNASMTRSGRCV